MDIGQLLSTAGFATNAQAREAAQAQLSTLAKENFPEYVKFLAQELQKDSNAVDTRILAALELKNQLVAKTPRAQQMYVQRYLALDPQLRKGLQDVALQTLTAPSSVSRAGAQLIAGIAGIDLPLNQWTDLPQILIQATRPDQADDTKKACLQTIGFICEGADPQDAGLVAQMDSLLTATIQGAQSTEPSPQVRLAAINALVNSLEFIHANFDREKERNIIMQVVCEATQAQQAELQSAAFGALGRIMALYYEYMAPYMEQALFALTLEGMRSSDENVICMAVEFWSTVSEEENSLQATQHPTAKNYHFAQAALPVILPAILSLLPRTDDNEEDDWSPTMAAGACLQLLALNVRDAIVEPALQFVSQNIQTNHWPQREAAVLAFGSILDGPNPDSLAQVINQAIDPLLGLMKDESSQVRDTVAWCLGRIADIIPTAINAELLPKIVEVLIGGIADTPKVSTNCCWCIMNLTVHSSPIPHGINSPMSPYYRQLIEALVQASSREDNEYSSRTSAYEALSTMVLYSPEDTQELVMMLSSTVIERLQNSLQLQGQVVSVEDGMNVAELQTNLLGLLTNIIRRVGSQVASAAEQLMHLLLQFLQNRLPNSMTDEDVFIAVGAVSGAIDEQFGRFAPAFMPFIVQALKDFEFPAARTAVGLIADISHAIGPDLAQYADVIMAEFMTILQSDEAPRDLKPIVLSCIGDIAASIGYRFEPYLDATFKFLEAGGELQPTAETSNDMLDYIFSLREALLDAYVGVLAGFREQPQTLVGYVSQIFKFLYAVSQDPEIMASEQALRSAVGLLGDVASMYPNRKFVHHYSEQWVSDMIKKAKDRQLSPATRETAKWAREQQKLQLNGS